MNKAKAAALSWQCRRGTLELDFLLQRYLETTYEQADDEEKNLFAALLQMEDSKLLTYLLGDQQVNNESMAFLINKIRNAATL